MAIKTISLELDAYEKLKRAKRTPRESFSSVVRRGRFELDDKPRTGKEILAHMQALRKAHPELVLSEREADKLERDIRKQRSVRRKNAWDE